MPAVVRGVIPFSTLSTSAVSGSRADGRMLSLPLIRGALLLICISPVLIRGNMIWKKIRVVVSHPYVHFPPFIRHLYYRKKVNSACIFSQWKTGLPWCHWGFSCLDRFYGEGKTGNFSDFWELLHLDSLLSTVFVCVRVHKTYLAILILQLFKYPTRKAVWKLLSITLCGLICFISV